MTPARRLFLLGLFLLAVFGVNLFYFPHFLGMSFQGLQILVVLVILAAAYAGIGLVVTHWPGQSRSVRDLPSARWTGAAFFFTIGGFCIVQYVQLVAARLPSLQLHMAPAIVCGAVTSVWIVWLCWRAIRLLVLPHKAGQRSRLGLTCVLTGLTFVVSALVHLGFAAAGFWGQPSGVTFSISHAGIYFMGFPGWIIWQAAALVAGILLLTGVRKTGRIGAIGLAVLFAAASPLLVFRILTLDLPLSMNAGMIAAAVFLPLLIAFSSWWLQKEVTDEARSRARSPT